MNKNYVMENFEEYNYDENIIQNLQYTNSLLNQRNISLEKELEKIKNKYNLCKQDLNNINKHISICKNNQDKIIKDLRERNDYLEQLNTNSKENNKLNSFIKKMKILFNNNNIEGEDIKDEDYLDIIGNNIIKMNE
jgi:predicted  nucleic acid-binding Zn-ribbon protein